MNRTVYYGGSMSNWYNDNTKTQIMSILKELEPVPGTQIQTGQVESQLNPRLLGSEIDSSAGADGDKQHINHPDGSRNMQEGRSESTL